VESPRELPTDVQVMKQSEHAGTSDHQHTTFPPEWLHEVGHAYHRQWENASPRCRYERRNFVFRDGQWRTSDADDAQSRAGGQPHVCIVLDVAHNAAALEKLVHKVSAEFPTSDEVHFLVGFSEGKDVQVSEPWLSLV